MQTGYDNYWIYQNSRHEPVLLPKNDNYIYPVLTENYKQIQNGGYPGHTTVAPLNNIESSCQNGQYKTPGSQCMWQSSLYSQPFNSSYSNNFHLQAFETQANSYTYLPQSSQAQQNSDMKSSAGQNKGNYKKHDTNRLPQNNNYADKGIARIRVKDVFSLNNTSIFNSSMNNSAVQSTELQKNKQYEYPLNFTTNNCIRTCDLQTNVSKSNCLPSSYLQIEQPGSNNQQHFLQYSNSFYEQNIQLSKNSQIQLNDRREMESNLPSTVFKLKPPLKKDLPSSRKSENNSYNVFKRTGAVNVTTNNMHDLSYLETFSPCSNTERTNNVDYNKSSEISETYDCLNTNSTTHIQYQASVHQNQVNFSKTNQAPSLSKNSYVEDLRKRQNNEQLVCISSTKNSPNNKINCEANNVINTITPYTNQNTNINPSKSSVKDNNSNLSMPILMESPNEIFHSMLNEKNSQNYIQNNGATPSTTQVNQTDGSTPPSGNRAFNTSFLSKENKCNYGAENSDCNYYKSMMTIPSNSVTSAEKFQTESVENLKRSNSQTSFLNSVSCSEDILENLNTNIKNDEITDEIIAKSHETELILKNKNTSNGIIVKQETSSLEIKNASLQLDQNTVYHTLEEIKTEKEFQNSTTAEFKQELRPSENLDLGEEIMPSNSNDISNINISKINKNLVLSKETDFESVTLLNDEKNAEKCTPILENSKNSFCEKENDNSNVVNQKSIECDREDNYKSKINRDKLDLLIQFLIKDEETVETKLCEENEQPVFDNKISKKKKEVSLIHSRRKLSKTHIVKNKNNSREMVSLLSHKTTRVEILQDSPKPQIVKTIRNSSKEQESKINCSDEITINNKRDGASAKQQESFDASQKTEKQKKILCNTKPNTEYVTSSKQKKKNVVEEENNVINIMQALQNLKSHFCMSCTLVSSIDSFWINVVSGELRCLNCFKKMTPKNDENILKFKTDCSDDGSSSEIDSFSEVKIQKSNENTEENKVEESYNTYDSECDYEKSNVKREVTDPVDESAKIKLPCTNIGDQRFASKSKKPEIKDPVMTSSLSRKKSFEELNKLKSVEAEEKNFTLKTKLDDCLKLENKTKRKVSVKRHPIPGMGYTPDLEGNSFLEKKSCSRKKSISEESHVPIKTPTVNRSKQFADSPEKKNISKDEIDNSKGKVHFIEDFKKEKKPVNQPLGKYTSKEVYGFLKTQMSKEDSEQDTKGNLEKSVKQSIFKQEDIPEFSRKEKKQSRESSQRRNRSSSKEEFAFHKIQISEKQEVDVSVIKSPSKEGSDFFKFHKAEETSKKSPNESMNKSNFFGEKCNDQKTKVSKQMKPKYLWENLQKKTSSTHKSIDKNKSTESVGQLGKRRQSMDDSIPCKIRIVEEGSRDIKFMKSFLEKSKTASSPKADDGVCKTFDHFKYTTIDSSRRKSEDDCLSLKEKLKSEMKIFTVSSDKTNKSSDKRRNNTSKENLSFLAAQVPEPTTTEIKVESSIYGIGEKEKKQCLKKTPKFARNNSEKEIFDGTKSSNNENHQKSSTGVKPLKENQKSEMKSSSETQKQKKKESHEGRRKYREKFDERVSEKKKNVEPTDEVKTVNNFEKKKFVEQECSKAQGLDKSQTVSTGKHGRYFIRQNKKEKALGYIFGKKKCLNLKEFKKICVEKPSSEKLLEKFY